MQRIVIVDYGMANLRSVQKAFEKVGFAAEITGDPSQVGSADKLVLPGVGAFCDAIARLREAGWDRVVTEHVRAGRPFLGICLGLQLLFDRSFEDGEFEGLGLVAGEVVRLFAVHGRKARRHVHTRVAADGSFHFRLKVRRPGRLRAAPRAR